MVFKVPVDPGEEFGGGGHPLPPGYRFPVAPREVNVTVKQVGVIPTFQVTWLDEEVIPPSTPTVATWQVRFVDEKVAGSLSNESDFPTKALNLSRYLNTVATAGKGSRLTYTHTEAGMQDGYVIVIGFKDFYGGPPSQPWLVRLQSSSLVISPDITDQSAVYYVETFNGAEYVNFTPEFTAPSDVFFFRGVQIYWDRYVTAALSEMGNTDIFTGASGATHQVSPYRRFPVNDFLALGRGTVSVTSGSADVVWASGDLFAAGWVGRAIFIQWPGGYGLPGGWPRRNVAIFTDTTHLTMDQNAAATGTFSFFTLKAVTAYFVSLSVYGSRRPDITGAPSITL
jgi:hypothetical protein